MMCRHSHTLAFVLSHRFIKNKHLLCNMATFLSNIFVVYFWCVVWYRLVVYLGFFWRWSWFIVDLWSFSSWSWLVCWFRSWFVSWSWGWGWLIGWGRSWGGFIGWCRGGFVSWGWSRFIRW